MKAITLRKLPPELARTIQRAAQKKHTSINKTVIELLEQSLTGAKSQRKPLHHDLDFLAGVWSAREAARFNKSLARQRTIDPDLWK